MCSVPPPSLFLCPYAMFLSLFARCSAPGGSLFRLSLSESTGDGLRYGSRAVERCLGPRGGVLLVAHGDQPRRLFARGTPRARSGWTGEGNACLNSISLFLSMASIVRRRKRSTLCPCFDTGVCLSWRHASFSMRRWRVDAGLLRSFNAQFRRRALSLGNRLVLR